MSNAGSDLRPWSDDDVQLLLAAKAEGMSSRDLAEMFGRTESAIRATLYRTRHHKKYLARTRSYKKALAIRTFNAETMERRWEPWTTADDTYLAENWGIVPVEIIARTLRRTYYACIARYNSAHKINGDVYAPAREAQK